MESTDIQKGVWVKAIRKDGSFTIVSLEERRPMFLPDPREMKEAVSEDFVAGRLVQNACTCFYEILYKSSAGRVLRQDYKEFVFLFNGQQVHTLTLRD